MEKDPSTIEEATSNTVSLPPQQCKRSHNEDSQSPSKVRRIGDSADCSALRLRERDIQPELQMFKAAVLDRMLAPEYDRQWTEDCQGIHTLKRIRQQAECAQRRNRVLVPKSTHKKLLIFDLDNTLVHCSESVSSGSHEIHVSLPTGKTVTAGLHVRPYAQECLQLASQYFEVAIFTASHPCYSQQVIDLLDPTHAYVQHRLFREDCILIDQKYLLKDLRVIENFDLKDIVIVENSVLSYGLQLYNGVPVSTWTGEAGDSHLRLLLKYFRLLATCEDVRELNREVFEGYYHCLGEGDA